MIESDNPLFTVIIANYNNGKYIIEAIDSILNQTYQNFEIIIVDDNSDDSSISIIRSKLDDKRIQLFLNESNQGVGYTKDKGLRLAKGEIIGFLDADDFLKNDALSKMLKEHKQYPNASIIYSTHYICDDKLSIVKVADYVGPIPKNTTYLTYYPNRRNHISHFATFKKEKVAMISGISRELKKAADKDLYFQLEEVGDLHYIDEPLYYYRHHKTNISLNEEFDEAYFWELNAKRRAYQRRLIMNIQNLEEHNIIQLYVRYCEQSIEKLKRQRQLKEQFENELQLLKNSYTYRLGYIILKPIKWLYSFMR